MVRVREADTVAVVIPVRDDAVLLHRCLTALTLQDRRPGEIVVVDNGSSDDSAAVAARFGARVVSVPIAGIPRAASAGYDAARGDVIARLDADSVPREDWIARIEDAFAGDPGLDFLTGEAIFYGACPLVHWIGRHLYIGGMYAVLTPALGHPPLFGSNMAMRADAWRSVRDGMHRSRRDIHDDLELSFLVAPDMTVRRDRDLVVGVSSRPFATWAALKRRLSWVLPTVRLHWPAQAPWNRRAERRRAAGRRRARSDR
ncbi:glycosyltransferase family 2 protein [Microbacterium sp. 18062]|uniref:glycosyltransferase family 2 protein n=1 Tax=Microbacterium sp. 18062 TaxID=2681410 RepID=UPI001357A7EE|nr:glycosyltransferase family 2 protein [Microbacterium sp. 18062]